jgi:ribonuclease D
LTSWIRDQRTLCELAARLEGSGAVAVDSEADSLHHYFTKVCLLQIASEDGGAWLVDPLSVRDLSPLAPLFAATSTVKVLHGADYDVSILKRDFGFEFASIFDTMLAARFLGWPEIGLQAVVRRELGTELSKANQRDDWSRRPLSPRQEAYAVADVTHLIELHRRLSRRLRVLGRLSWVEEENAAVQALPAARQGSAPDAFLRIKGAGRLDRRGLAVLRALCGWREGVAASVDRPAFHVLANERLLELARKPPRAAADLRRLAGLPPRARARADEVAAVVAAALALPREELPEPPRRQRPELTEAATRAVSSLRRWRQETAARLELDVSVVLPQRLLERVAQAAPRDRDQLLTIAGLRRWRVEAFGDSLLSALSDS